MVPSKFLLSGEDKKTLSGVKNVLTSNGHIYLGYSSESSNLLRHIRSLSPELVIVEAGSGFRQIRPVLEIIDEELLSACILILESRNDEIMEYLSKTRIMCYLVKPIFGEVVLQITDFTMINFIRVIEYEKTIRKLNETLESRKVVEKAKWILVEQDKIPESEAYDIIRKKSRDNRLPMREIAEAIIITRGN